MKGWFELEELGLQQLKGVNRPIPAFLVKGTTAAATRLDAAGRGLTPLVGRGRELDELLDAWNETAAGEGPRRAAQRRARDRQVAARARAAPAGAGHGPPHRPAALLALPPQQRAVPALRRARAGGPARRTARGAAGGARRRARAPRAGRRGGGPAARRAARDRARLAARQRQRVRRAAQAPHARRAPGLAARAGRRRAAAARGRGRPLGRSEHARAARALLRRPIRVAGVLMLVTHRDEFVPPWPHRGYTRRLALDHLDSDDVREVLGRLTGGRPLPETLEGQIALRAAGVPLYVEELTRTVLESGAVEEHGRPARGDGDAAGAARAVDAARVADGAAGPARRGARGGAAARGAGPRRRRRLPRRRLRARRGRARGRPRAARRAPTSCARRGAGGRAHLRLQALADPRRRLRVAAAQHAPAAARAHGRASSSAAGTASPTRARRSSATT